MSETPFLSLIIPAYNESARIAPTLESVGDYFRRATAGVEVIVVDDGSTDATAAVVRQLIPTLAATGVSLQVVQNPGNQGKGYSVRHGFLKARGDLVLFSDADLSTPLSETPKLLAPITSEQYDAAIGSRDLPDSQIGTHQSALRELAGRTFNRFMRLTTGLSYADTQCGFKAFRRDVFLPVFQSQRVKGFAFDVEILYLARKVGARVAEVPVVWNHAEGSKVGFNWRSVRPFWDVAALRWRDWQGGYTPLSAVSRVMSPGPAK
ncbi:MAG: dolichyl-phosphate beta-glucosyltransferase [Chloracidobacterium sp.]|uniref:dolichyl-phosphate beta-glucosyltransferase n=1 Tax=Chloracidobacterium validum TaxID=2821543 RepID=A0ABX8B694_9BACT|nr:dolichyl-phosphate beta-glucosyltransferase [Chloracidobacterium validum]QUW02146.1 glycosyltransferase family 2 protein [Chloracidobacterium validum]